MLPQCGQIRCCSCSNTAGISGRCRNGGSQRKAVKARQSKQGRLILRHAGAAGLDFVVICMRSQEQTRPLKSEISAQNVMSSHDQCKRLIQHHSRCRCLAHHSRCTHACDRRGTRSCGCCRRPCTPALAAISCHAPYDAFHQTIPTRGGCSLVLACLAVHLGLPASGFFLSSCLLAVHT